MPAERIVCLRNPAAGRGARAPAGIELLATPPPGSDDGPVLSALRALDPARDVLAIAGGDGTLHYALGALARSRGESAAWPRLALVPAGSANDGARALEGLLGRRLARDPSARLAELRAALDAGEAGTPADVGRVVTGAGERALFANFAALGAPADWARRSAAPWLRPLKRLSVRLAYGLCDLLVIARARTHRAAIGLDGAEPAPTGLFAWFAANARYLGGGLDLGPDVALDSGALATLLVPPAPRRTLVGLLRAAGRGEGRKTTPARTVDLRLPAATALNLDGELWQPRGSGPLTVRIDVLAGRARWL